MSRRILTTVLAVLLTLVAAPPALAQPDAAVPTTGLLTWLRADAAALTVDADGFVTRWADRGPAGNDAVPTYDDGAATTGGTIGGQPALTFDGDRDMYEMDFSIDPADAPELTVISVVVSDSADESPLRKVYGHDDGGFDRVAGIDPRGPEECNYGYFGGPGNGFQDYFGLQGGETYILSDVWARGAFRGYIDLDAVVTSPADNGSGLPQTYVGGTGTVFNEFWDGEIAEVLMWNRELGAGELASVQRYLMDRYGPSGPTTECGVEPPEDIIPSGPSRIDTDNATEGALNICQLLVEDGGADELILARDDDFADALSGTQLPNPDCILFTTGGPEGTLDPPVRAEIERALTPGGVVWVLGGANAVSTAVTDELTTAGIDVRRLSGPSRFETAETIAGQAMSDLVAAGRQPADVIVGFGLNWPDVITAGAYARASGSLIALTATDSLHPAAANVVAAADGARVVIVGGEGVVGPQVAEDLPDPIRVSGANRMATAAQIAQQLWPTVPDTGEDFVFANLERTDSWTLALASAPLAATIGGPQLGVRHDSLPQETADYLQARGIESTDTQVFLGDLSYISDDTLNQVGALSG